MSRTLLLLRNIETCSLSTQHAAFSPREQSKVRAMPGLLLNDLAIDG